MPSRTRPGPVSSAGGSPGACRRRVSRVAPPSRAARAIAGRASSTASASPRTEVPSGPKSVVRPASSAASLALTAWSGGVPSPRKGSLVNSASSCPTRGKATWRGSVRARMTRMTPDPTRHGLRFDAHLSTLFTELPLLERPRAAREAGFDAVECWWPFDAGPGPPGAEVAAFVSAIEDAGVRLVSLNFCAGDMAAGDSGLVSWPGREAELRESVEVALDIARRLGTRRFNAL